MSVNKQQEVAERVRGDLLGVMGDVADCQRRWRWSALSSGFAGARDKLANPEYDVVVCGEVKRGKSSFINALIGQDLLPTGVKETTSQVFRISAAKKESFALVFEDGHWESISREELARYGSQTAADLEGMPLFRGRQLRWIEVKTPAVFLPEGVHLVDTPGLGALYAAHSEITGRYITQADAVIFTIDSGQPLTQSEMRFLETCMEVTPNILFIQTKTDLKSESDWQDIQKRNETLLNTRFHKEGRPPFRVFPVSSKLLAESARESDAQERAYLLEDSLFDVAKRGLELVMFRATGWTRCAWAAAEASRYVDTTRKALDEQLKVLLSESASEKDDLRRKKLQVRSEFQKQWGAEGAKRNQFMTELNRIMQGVRSSAAHIGSQGTELYSALSREINNLSSREAIEAFAREMPDRVQSSVSKEWREIIVAAQNQVKRLDEKLPMLPESDAPFFVNLPSVNIQKGSLWDRVKHTNIDGMIGGGLATVAAGLFMLTGGLATIAIAAGTVIAAWKGHDKILSQQMEAARRELRDQLIKLLAQCHAALCAADIAKGRPMAIVDAFIEDTIAKVKSTLEEQYSDHKERLEAQERTLEEQAKLTGQQRESQIAEIRAQLERNSELQQQLQRLVDELREMQAQLNKAEAEMVVPSART
jgi:GTP-binding protein EngB required for normal cell division